MSADKVGVGLVGAGAYGEFCLAAFAAMPEVRIASVCDTDSARATRFAAQYSAQAYTNLAGMLNDPAVDIVALNTPPFLHAQQGIAVLEAGKHLFCEKPLAMSLEEGEILRATAERTNARVTIDYVMRRNPLWRAAVAIRESGVLGKLLHVNLTNHAAGLNLPWTHWFWDKTKSGGIWIEHGVHFFDAFAWVTGAEGRVAAQAFINAAGHEDRVEALATYDDTAAHFYHGFTHSGDTERTWVTLTFERGELTLKEWVPTVLDCSTRLDIAKIIRPLIEDEVDEIETEQSRHLIVQTRGDKSAVYRRCIQHGMRDLANAVRNPSHLLAVGIEHGLASLRMAVDAERFGM